jgi:GNAT superfamily N-acetyltransferase
VDIRECRAGDVEVLETSDPSPGLTRYHARRFERQEKGLSTYLIAWADGVPVGRCEIRWCGCDAPEVNERFPDCPELNGLEVWPAALRSHGIGTALISAVECRVRDRGYALLGLGVNDDNPRAAALYLRLGFRETACHYFDRYFGIDDQGRRLDFADPTRFLVKELT